MGRKEWCQTPHILSRVNTFYSRLILHCRDLLELLACADARYTQMIYVAARSGMVFQSPIGLNLIAFSGLATGFLHLDEY